MAGTGLKRSEVCTWKHLGVSLPVLTHSRQLLSILSWAHHRWSPQTGQGGPHFQGMQACQWGCPQVQQPPFP